MQKKTTLAILLALLITVPILGSRFILDEERTDLSAEPASELLAPSIDPEDILITPLNHLNQEYEILKPGIFLSFKEIPESSLRSDPTMVAVRRALTAAADIADSEGGDAIIGMRIEISERSARDEGGVLIYGTIVKFK